MPPTGGEFRVGNTCVTEAGHAAGKWYSRLAPPQLRHHAGGGAWEAEWGVRAGCVPGMIFRHSFDWSDVWTKGAGYLTVPSVDLQASILIFSSLGQTLSQTDRALDSPGRLRCFSLYVSVYLCGILLQKGHNRQPPYQAPIFAPSQMFRGIGF